MNMNAIIHLAHSFHSGINFYSKVLDGYSSTMEIFSCKVRTFFYLSSDDIFSALN